MTRRAPNLPAILRPEGQEVAISEESATRNKAYALKSKSPRTLKEYQRCWQQFAQWCESVGRNPIPLPEPKHAKGDSIEQREDADAAYRDSQLAALATLATYVTWLADGQGSGTSMAASTINQALSAIKFVQAGKRCKLDYKDPDLQMVIQGARRQASQTRTIRRVQGISSEQLVEILDTLDLDNLRDARDAAVLSLGWAACRRRSEVVGLDWNERGATKGSTGVLTIDEKGLHIQLMVSKTKQEGEPEYYAVPRDTVPKSVAAVENWVRLCGTHAGDPVFRSLLNMGRPSASKVVGVWRQSDERWRAVSPGRNGEKRRRLGTYATEAEAIAALEAHLGKTALRTAGGYTYRDRRMHPQSIAQIVKGRLRQLFKKKHPRWKRDQIEAEVAKYSGHSMRVGHITDAAERGVPAFKIQNQSGHKDSKMISVYSRVTEKFRDNSLRGVRSGL